MLKYIFALWNSDYAYYTFGCLFLLMVVRQFCYRFRKLANESCCQVGKHLSPFLLTPKAHKRVWEACLGLRANLLAHLFYLLYFFPIFSFFSHQGSEWAIREKKRFFLGSLVCRISSLQSQEGGGVEWRGVVRIGKTIYKVECLEREDWGTWVSVVSFEM